MHYKFDEDTTRIIIVLNSILNRQCQAQNIMELIYSSSIYFIIDYLANIIFIDVGYLDRAALPTHLIIDAR